MKGSFLFFVFSNVDQLTLGFLSTHDQPRSKHYDNYNMNEWHRNDTSYNIEAAKMP